MAKQKIDSRRIKIHRSYTIDEAARCLGVHKKTVSTWLKSGLPCIRDRRPYLILGKDLKQYLQERKRQRRKPCRKGQLFCLKCNEPRYPAGKLLDYVPITPTSGNLKGICEVCGTLIFRRVSLARLDEVTAGCDVAFPQQQKRLTEKF